MDWGRTQEPVYDRAGAVVGAVVYDEWQQCWRGISASGRQQAEFASRQEAERVVKAWARAPRAPQQPRGTLSGPQVGAESLSEVTGALVAGAAFLGGLAALLGTGEQPARADDQAAELRRQNELLRRQNELLQQTISRLGPQDLARRRR